MRQALFNIQDHAAWSQGLHGARILDLFAGSGALGLEALSRGADICCFIDNDPGAVEAIKANIGALGLADRAQVVRGDATALGERPVSREAAFDIAYLDPPYDRGLAEAALAKLAQGRWLAAEAMAVVERGATEAPLIAPGFETLDSRAWGAARVWFLRARLAPD